MVRQQQIVLWASSKADCEYPFDNKEEKNMNNTALGAKNTKKQEIVFISEAHEKFYYEKLKEVRYQDVGVS